MPRLEIINHLFLIVLWNDTYDTPTIRGSCCWY